MNDSHSQLYVAIHIQTGLFSTRLKSFLMNEKAWIEATNPTREEVIEQIQYSNVRHTMWTNIMNDAEVWDEYSINEYKKYLTNITFKKVSLNVQFSPK